VSHPRSLFPPLTAHFILHIHDIHHSADDTPLQKEERSKEKNVMRLSRSVSSHSLGYPSRHSLPIVVCSRPILFYFDIIYFFNSFFSRAV
jgi:hypothetical protein